MSKRKVLLLLIAGLIALGTMAVARSMIKVPEQAQETQVATTQVLAATRNIPTGTILKEMDMKWITWPADADTSQLYIKGKDDMNRLVGGVLRDGIRTGEPFLTGRIVQPNDHGFLAAVLEPGKRAISLQLTPSAEIAGFIFPGDHVDVILTHSFSRKDVSDLTERRVSETIVSDARVLALDQKSDSQSADPKVAQLATLEVSPKQAEKLALAADIVGLPNGNNHGSLSLVLRSLARDETSTGTPATEGGTTWDSDVSPAYPGVNGGDSLMQKVHIMRGKEATDTNFEQHK